MQYERFMNVDTVTPGPSRAAGDAAVGAMLLPLVLAQFVCSYAASNMNVAISDIARDLGTNVDGRPAGDHAVHADDGRADDPGQQAVGHLRAQAHLHGRADRLRDRRPPRCRCARTRPADRGLLVPPRHRDRAADPARLHPRDRVLHGHDVARPSLRLDQRCRWHRRGRRSADRWSDHEHDELAGVVRGPGADGRRDHRPQPTDRRTRRRRRGSRGSISSAPSSRQPDCSSSWSGSSRRRRTAGSRPPRTLSSAESSSSRKAGSRRSGCWSSSAPRCSRGSSGISDRWSEPGGEPLLSTRMFLNRTANLGSRHPERAVAGAARPFVRRVRVPPDRPGLQRDRDRPHPHARRRSASSCRRWARPDSSRRYPQAVIIRAGFVLTIAGVVLLLAFANATSNVLTFAPGLLVVGLGVGAMLTSSVNVVQSSFPEADQGEISGLSRSVSNLGSSLGVAIAGSVIVSSLVTGQRGVCGCARGPHRVRGPRAGGRDAA